MWTTSSGSSSPSAITCWISEFQKREPPGSRFPFFGSPGNRRNPGRQLKLPSRRRNFSFPPAIPGPGNRTSRMKGAFQTQRNGGNAWRIMRSWVSTGPGRRTPWRKRRRSTAVSSAGRRGGCCAVPRTARSASTTATWPSGTASPRRGRSTWGPTPGGWPGTWR